MQREPCGGTINESVSTLLGELNRGNREALPRLMPVVYAELRRLAARYMAHERRGHTLQPTALVNEAYLRLVEEHDRVWEGKAHFFAVAAQVMRHILVDRARSRLARKRGGGAYQVTLAEDVAAAESRSVDLLALDQALTRLAALDPRQARVVELRFFAGLSVEEIAKLLSASDRTIKRDWRMAKAWLHAELTAENGKQRHGTADEQ